MAVKACEQILACSGDYIKDCKLTESLQLCLNLLTSKQTSVTTLKDNLQQIMDLSQKGVLVQDLADGVMQFLMKHPVGIGLVDQVQEEVAARADEEEWEEQLTKVRAACPVGADMSLSSAMGMADILSYLTDVDAFVVKYEALTKSDGDEKQKKRAIQSKSKLADCLRQAVDNVNAVVHAEKPSIELLQAWEHMSVQALVSHSGWEENLARRT